jgi:hypothetical protein
MHKVVIKSDLINIIMDSNTFLRKLYRVDGDNIFINGRRILISEIEISIQFDLIISKPDEKKS